MIGYEDAYLGNILEANTVAFGMCRVIAGEAWHIMFVINLLSTLRTFCNRADEWPG